MTENEIKVLRAAAKASLRTGVCVSVHPGRSSQAPMQIVQIMKAAGAGELHSMCVVVVVLFDWCVAVVLYT